jgi:hypothetical protein
LNSINCSLPDDVKKEVRLLEKDFIEKIENDYQVGDELWHFNNFGVAPLMSSREYIILRRNNETVKTFLIKMS